jgi:hypothetical protein
MNMRWFACISRCRGNGAFTEEDGHKSRPYNREENHVQSPCAVSTRIRAPRNDGGLSLTCRQADGVVIFDLNLERGLPDCDKRCFAGARGPEVEIEVTILPVVAGASVEYSAKER